MLSGANSLTHIPSGQTGERIEAVIDYLSGGLRCVNYVWDTETLDWVAASAMGGDVGSISSPATTYDILMDDQGTYMYVGEAVPATLTSAPSWKIKKVTDTSVKYAGGVATFTKIWDNRAGYIY